MAKKKVTVVATKLAADGRALRKQPFSRSQLAEIIRRVEAATAELRTILSNMDKEGYSELDIDGASKGDRGITLLKEFSLHTEFALRQRMLSP
jgi:hypothetical protein